MAIRKILPSPAQESKADLMIKCRDWLRHIEEQRALASEMINTARSMCDRAKEMRKPARNIILS